MVQLQYLTMRPKARGLAQHGGPPGSLEESDPAGVILYVMDVPYRLPFCAGPVALTGAAQLRADGVSGCCYIVTIRHELGHARKAWPGTLKDPWLLSGL
jgi:hypothetical protein